MRLLLALVVLVAVAAPVSANGLIPADVVVANPGVDANASVPAACPDEVGLPNDSVDVAEVCVTISLSGQYLVVIRVKGCLVP